MAVKLTVPISEEQIRALNVGDQVLLSGVIFTARDVAHKYMMDHFINRTCPASERAVYDELKRGLADSVIYHCGPVVLKGDDGKYKFVAAGPTTSAREESCQADVIRHFGVRGVIDKGGMRGKTLAACRQHGAAYLHAIGGAATLIAESCTEVIDVFKLDFRVPEAFWKIRVKDFPCVVTMDSHGNNMHADVLAKSKARAAEILRTL